MKHTIGGNITVKNSISWDYCLRECVESLLPVCDVINLVDSDSTDGTPELLAKLASQYKQVRLLNYPWPNVIGDPDCLLKKMNWSRERLGTHFHLHLEADEVLGPESVEWILHATNNDAAKVIMMRRINFWKDHQNILMPGQILSPHVIRLAPTSYYMGGDAPHPLATQTEPNADWDGIHHCNIYHYGFLRRTGGYRDKYRNLMTNFNGSDRADGATMDWLDKCSGSGESWMAGFKFQLSPFEGQHPEIVKPWLRERGYGI